MPQSRLFSDASFSDCRTFRYALRRRWGVGAPAAFIGLNPSTADDTHDDPTIRRCVDFARRWGFGGLTMVNLFAFRATDPWMLGEEQAKNGEVVGADNDGYLLAHAKEAGIVVAAWGAWRGVGVRADAVRALCEQHGVSLYALGMTRGGHPRHPLYLRADTRPLLWPYGATQ